MSRKNRHVQKVVHDDRKTHQNNVYAIKEGPQKKKWTKHDILQIQPLTEMQNAMFQCYFQGSHIIAHGSAGTGKTFLALYLALMDAVDPDYGYKQIRIVRSVVPSREIGHLPGTIEEKVGEYEIPYISVCQDLSKPRRPSTYADMKEAGLIEFTPTSFIRGSTWNDTIVIVDEAQNMTWHELNSIVTRIGDNSRLIITGDTRQCDLVRKNDISGFAQFIKVAESVPSFATVQFTSDDIVRSGFVKEWIVACEKLGL